MQQVLFCTKTNQQITLVKQIAHSGEGEVWTTNLHKLLAKLYHHPTAEKFTKLEVMINHKPEDPNRHQGHNSFAFPHSLIKNKQGKLLGFLMPQIENAIELIDIYNPKRRKLKKLEVDWHFLHYVALNIASIMAAIHREGYVIGDIKPQNILVNSQALPSFIDTDSFQVKDPNNGKLYHCPVGTDGYTPPELIGEDFHKIEQTTSHDDFRLGILIYQLLFSYHPFGLGKWTGTEDKPEQNDLIKQGIWLESRNSLLIHNHHTIPLNIVHPSLQECFLKCFNEGHKKPHLRPTAIDWFYALTEAVNQLKICSQVESHIYSVNSQNCYWCDRKLNLGTDIFELPQGIKPTSKKRISTTSFIAQSHSSSNNTITVKTTKTVSKQPSQNINVTSKNNITNQVTTNPNKDNFFIQKIYYPLKIYLQTIPIIKNLSGKQLALIIATSIILPISWNLRYFIQLTITRNCINCNLEQANLSNQNLSNANLSNANLTNANLSKTNLTNANLTNANLTNTDLANANLTNALLKDPLSLSYAKINNNTILPNTNPIDNKKLEEFSKNGHKYLQAGEYEKALENFNQALRLNPKSYIFYRYRGTTYYILKEYHKAIENFDQALRLNPNDSGTLSLRGRTYLQLAKTEK